MKKVFEILVKQPYSVFGVLILFILISSFLAGKRNLDFQLHDTYFVFSVIHIGLAFCVLLAVPAVIYWLSRNKRLISWMTGFHVISLIVILILMALYIIKYNQPIVFGDMESYKIYIRIWSILMLCLFLSNLIFLINIFIAWIARTGPK